MDALTAYRLGLLSSLAEVVDELSKIVAAIPTHTWHLPGELSSHTPHYILAHLRELEAQVFIFQLHRILDEDVPRLVLFDDERWMASHYTPEEPVPEILAGFTNLRKQELEWLRGLSSADWSRTARHPWWGVRTLQWWVEQQSEYSIQQLSELASFHAI